MEFESERLSNGLHSITLHWFEKPNNSFVSTLQKNNECKLQVCDVTLRDSYYLDPSYSSKAVQEIILSINAMWYSCQEKVTSDPYYLCAATNNQLQVAVNFKHACTIECVS